MTDEISVTVQSAGRGRVDIEVRNANNSDQVQRYALAAARVAHDLGDVVVTVTKKREIGYGCANSTPESQR